jgi:hypothetical protein
MPKHPILCILNSHNNNHVRIMNNFRIGVSSDLITIRNWLENRTISSHVNSVIFQGILRGNNHLMTHLDVHNVPYFYFDHAYFFNGYNSKSEWIRISKNGLHTTQFTHYPQDRWDKYFAPRFQLKKWRLAGKRKIFVYPPSSAIQFVDAGSRLWQTEVISKLRLMTDKQIIVKIKSEQPILDKSGNIVGRTAKNRSRLEDDLREAHCVVTYNSSVAVKAAIAGVPVICHKNSPHYAISNGLHDIENLKEFDRQPWLNFLSYSQFNTDEFKSGEAWRIVNQ